MTASALQEMLTEASRKLNSPSQVVRAAGSALLRRAERFLESGQPFELEVECAWCWRWPRNWFATGVAEKSLHPLCCRACIAKWKERNPGCVVLKRDGREYVDRPETARRAA